MTKTIISISFLFISLTMQAQDKTSVAGEYYLQGVRETASGFKLNDDSTFQFFFTYGALDRYGSGKWSIQDNKIILNSKPYPGRDFKMTDSVSDKNSSIVLKFEDPNSHFFRFIHCLVNTKNGDTLYDATNDGRIILTDKSITTLYIIFELCPEKISTFNINPSLHNVYTFRFEPWIVEVFFKDFALRFADNHLEGKHPLLDEKDYYYEKE